jgi:hypothetical protein
MRPLLVASTSVDDDYADTLTSGRWGRNPDRSAPVGTAELLREPGGCEGLIVAPVRLEAHHHLVADREFVRACELDWYTAAVPGGRDPDEDEHALVVQVEEALRLKVDR